MFSPSAPSSNSISIINLHILLSNLRSNVLRLSNHFLEIKNFPNPLMDSSDCSPSTAQTIKTFNESEKDADSKESGSSGNGKIGKNGPSKEMGHLILNSVNRSALQIRKPPHRKISPLNWFPRKKTDSYLNRKIRLFQEVGGMKSSLDETLGNSNPHYSRVLREKIAAREAASKAMGARKAALVEASWCRILRAARIPTAVAESQLARAEETAAEAFKEAASLGVIMYDKPDCPERPCDVEISSVVGGSTHTVTASFETAFDVDKEVAAAVKTAFIQLANCPNSSNREEFRELLWKISQNPETSGTNQDTSEELPSDCGSDNGSEFESSMHGDVESKEPIQENLNKLLETNHLTKSANLSTGLVDIMLARLKLLQEEELASLATIVATCGLNAVLEEIRNGHNDSSMTNCTVGPEVVFIRNVPSTGYLSITQSITQMRRHQGITELPSLDKFLVKHVSRLEREVQEAKKGSKNDRSEANGKIMDRSSNESNSTNSIAGKAAQSASSEQCVEQDAGSQTQERASVIKCIDTMDVKQLDKENLNLNKIKSMNLTVKKGMAKKLPPKRFMSRIDKAKLEVLEAFSINNENNSLDKILIKPKHRLERVKMQVLASKENQSISGEQKKHETEVAAADSLDKVLIKHVSRIEKEKLVARQKEDFVVKENQSISGEQKKHETEVAAAESLDKVLIKHVSRIEKEKLAARQKEDFVVKVKKDQSGINNVESLDKILIKRQSGLEKDKSNTLQQAEEECVKHSDIRREARERELREAWGGLSLGNSIKPHLSTLERDKARIRAAWARAEEEERRRIAGKLV